MEIIKVGFRGHDYFLTDATCPHPKCLEVSFCYEIEVRENWWDIKPGDVVIDVGAAFGSYTIPALLLGAKKVIALEPAEVELFDLMTNVTLNSFVNCHFLNVLAWEANTFVAYFPDSHSVRQEGNPEIRMAITIDRIADIFHLERLDWMKIDTEGAEIQVLRGALETLKKYSPRLLIENHCQFFPDIDKEAEEILVPLGYVQDKQLNKGGNENWVLWRKPDSEETVGGLKS